FSMPIGRRIWPRPSGCCGLSPERRSFTPDHACSLIGAHCGQSIAVTLNDNLDYFGQTVNVAARVQSLAAESEICISEALYAATGVRDLLAGRDVVAFDAPIRGVDGSMRLYRIPVRA